MKWAVLLLAIGFVGGFYARHKVDGVFDTITATQQKVEQLSAINSIGGWFNGETK